MSTTHSYNIDGKDVPGEFGELEFGHIFLFDEPITVNNGQELKITYIVTQYYEGCEPDGEDDDVAGSDNSQS